MMHATPFTPGSTFSTTTCTNGSTSFTFVLKMSLSVPSPLWFSAIGDCLYATKPSQVAVDVNGNLWVGGPTSSSFPTVAPLELQGTDQGFLAELSPDGSKLLFSSYAPPAFALGPQQTLYLTGASVPNPPKVDTQPFATAASALVAKVDVSAMRAAVIDSISTTQPPAYGIPNQFDGIAPGEMIRITGRGLGPTATLVAQIDSTGRVASSLGGIRVLFNGVPAPLISVQASTIICMTPFEVTGNSSASVQIEQNGAAIPGVAVGVTAVALAPVVLSVANQDASLNSQSNPAHPGQIVTFYVTGFGGTNPSVPDGSLYQVPLPVPMYSLYGSPLLTYAGPAPGLVAGIWQVNVMLDSNAASGANPLNVSVDSSYMVGPYSPAMIVPVWVAP
jgi:uncharacterized protein (TIGR03437 family)